MMTNMDVSTGSAAQRRVAALLFRFCYRRSSVRSSLSPSHALCATTYYYHPGRMYFSPHFCKYFPYSGDNRYYTRKSIGKFLMLFLIYIVLLTCRSYKYVPYGFEFRSRIPRDSKIGVHVGCIYDVTGGIEQFIGYRFEQQLAQRFGIFRHG